MNEDVLNLVVETVDREADDLGYESLRRPSRDTPLFGAEEGIDSLSLVRLVAAVERAAEQRFQRRVVLADDKAMSMRNSPFRTVGALAELLEARLGVGNG